MAQIETALNALIVWSTSAPISQNLKLKLQDASNAVKDQLDADPFSCCDTLKTLQELEIVLSKVVSALPPGQQLHLLGLVQQLQALFAEYIACLACTPGPTGATGPQGPQGLRGLTGAQGPTGFFTSNYALIGNTTGIGAIAVNTAIPLNVNAVGPVGTNISHTASNRDIILQPGVYYVAYSASPVDGMNFGIVNGLQLRLNGNLLPLTDSYVSGNDGPFFVQTLTASGIVNVTAPNSILNLVTVLGTINFSGVVTITIFQIA
ncbi:collagen-like protein [Bacillus toyonensis]|uniref:collagen-like protein n=1 Tax=Bacillus toyonensis TaxID=155322 RepID=UPI0011457333|nr:collagen-like protein [Bacillus toyonensis]